MLATLSLGECQHRVKMSRATHLVGTADLHQSADPPGRRSALPGRATLVLMGRSPTM